MKLYRRSRTTDYMVVGAHMWDVESWVSERLGSTKMSTDGKQITIYDATRPPGMYGDSRKGSWATANKGNYVMHNGDGQFRVLTKAQFNYWYQEEE
jgi:hypothetical protein